MKPRERFLAACRCEPVDRPPVWIMRQAGRYLPEYREIRARHDFLTVCQRPDLASEVTLQPIRRFGMDAAIIFSDILVIPDAMGQKVDYPEGGPVLSPPIRTVHDLRRLKPFEPSEALGYVAEALHTTRSELGQDHALLGFAGAPYTLMTYMVQGGGSKNQAETKELALKEPDLVVDLLERLADAVARFLALQVEAGADAVQLFDTWAGDLSPPDFERLALAPARRVIERLQDAGVPIVYFVNGVAAHLHRAAQTGARVLGIDWRLDLGEARQRLGPDVALQGNLDPAVLLGPAPEIQRRVRAIHESLDPPTGHIFNLGHGVWPNTPPESVGVFVDAVKSLASGAST